MSAVNAAALLAAAGGEYQISRSVRTRKSAAGYFSRTPASASNRKTWTLSKWVKFGDVSGSIQSMFGTMTTSNYTIIGINSAGQGSASLTFESISGTTTIIGRGWTNAVYRDPSAWYHVVVALDTTQAVSTDRLKIYVNGVLQSLSSYTAPTQNSDHYVNQASVSHALMGGYSTAYTTDGYLTEVNFIDGQALTPASFGETDAVTGVWKPKKYAGTYGTNGFYLNFSDNSAATAAAIGKDYSGNGNNWTPNNISVTAGVTYDSMLDTPTPYADGGNGRGNYAVMNPLKRFSANQAITAGNLTTSDNSAGVTSCVATMSTGTSGKYYFECTMTAVASNTAGSGSNYIGVTNESNAVSNAPFNNGGYRSGNPIYNLAGAAQTAGSTYTTGDVIGVAVDVTSGTVQFYKNNVAQGATPSFTFTAGTELWPFATTDNVAGTKTFDFNFGQRPFAYTPPTGFRALNTQNLPDATIKKGNQYFDVTTYTGNGSTQSIVNSGAMQPDFVWVKSRTNPASGIFHTLLDSARGLSSGFYRALFSNSTDAEDTPGGVSSPGTVYGGVTSFNSNGFTLSAGSSDQFLNKNTTPYIAWQWKESASAGFDIVTFSPNGSGITTVNHSLGVAPSMIITKTRAAVGSWTTYHAALGNTQYIYLNLTNAAASGSTVWNNTSPTSTQFTLGSAFAGAGTTVAYLFAEVAGFSKFGSFTGNGSADGPFVYCGFRPRFVMLKNASAVGGWVIYDTSRGAYNANTLELYPNLSNAEGTGSNNIDVLSNGFKVRGPAGGYSNGSGNTIIFAAFAENPFKNSLAR